MAPRDRRALEPRLTLHRLLSGVVGGVAAGLLFGLLMVFKVIGRNETTLEGSGIVPAIASAIGTDFGVYTLMVAWVVHIVNSALFGALFALFVAPRRYAPTIGWALLWAVLLWGFGAFLALRLLTGTPLLFDRAAMFSLQGHLLYGLLLGLVYVWFHRLLEDYRPTLHPKGAAAGP